MVLNMNRDPVTYVVYVIIYLHRPYLLLSTHCTSCCCWKSLDASSVTHIISCYYVMYVYTSDCVISKRSSSIQPQQWGFDKKIISLFISSILFLFDSHGLSCSSLCFVLPSWRESPWSDKYVGCLLVVHYVMSVAIYWRWNQKPVP